MAVAIQPVDFSDLKEALMERLLENTGNSTTEEMAGRAINTALHDMHVGFDYRYPWAERHAYLTLQPDYTDGSVDVTQGSQTVTGNSTSWDTAGTFGSNNAVVGAKIKINGTREVYEITAIASDTSLTIGSPYIGSTVSAGEYTIFQDEYTLESDFFKPVNLHYFDQDQSIPFVGRTEFRRLWNSNRTPGKVQVATLQDATFDSNTTRVKRIVFHPPPADAEQIKYYYITTNLAVSSAGAEQTQMSADADEPIVPLRYRHALVLYAIYNWYRDRKDDVQRAQLAQAEYRDLMLRIAQDNEIGGAHPRVSPNISPYASRARRPYRGRGSRRYDPGGGGWDRLEW